MGADRDTASAALLRKHLDEAYRLVDWLYQDRRETDVRDIAHKALKQIKEAMLLAAQKLPIKTRFVTRRDVDA